MIDIKEIYKNLSEYDITKENVLQFLFQGDKEDLSHFYFRNMLLQLLENGDHLDKIIEIYYKIERGSIFSDEYNVNINGRVSTRSESDTLKKSRQKLFTIYSQFGRGEYEELNKVLNWASKISKQLASADPYECGYIYDSLIEPINEFDELKDMEKSIRETISKNKKQNDENRKQMSESKELTVVRKKKDLTRIVTHKHFIKLRFVLEKIRRKKENRGLESKLQDVESKIEEQLNKLRQIYSSKELEGLFEEIYSRYQYYNEETSMYRILYGFYRIRIHNNILVKFFRRYICMFKDYSKSSKCIRKNK